MPSTGERRCGPTVYRVGFRDRRSRRSSAACSVTDVITAAYWLIKRLAGRPLGLGRGVSVSTVWLMLAVDLRWPIPASIPIGALAE